MKGSSSKRLKAIPANFGKDLVLAVAKDRGLGDFTTVQDAIKAVPVINKNKAVPMINKNPVMISVKPNI